MVVAAYPLAKIGLLLMKQLSKPLANAIKNEAKRHPVVRKYVVAPIGKVYNWVEVKSHHIKGTQHEVVKPTEEEIVELGSNAIGEIVLFGLLTMILLAELNRQGDKKASLEKVKAEEILNLQDAVLDLVKDVDSIKSSIENMQQELYRTDVFALEEIRHNQIHDHNFLDVLGEKRVWKKFWKDDQYDKSDNSPTV